MRNNRAKDTLVIGTLAGISAKIVHTLLGFFTISFIPSYLNCTRIAAGLLLTSKEEFLHYALLDQC